MGNDELSRAPHGSALSGGQGELVIRAQRGGGAGLTVKGLPAPPPPVALIFYRTLLNNSAHVPMTPGKQPATPGRDGPGEHESRTHS